MEVNDVIRDRRAIHDFSPDPIPDDAVYKIIDAARWAPSPFNTQPWEFIIIRNSETLNKLAECVHGGECNAPMAIAVVILPITAKYPFHQQMDEPAHAGAMAVQNIMLTAWDMGIGTAWATIDKENVKNILNIPKEFDVLTIIPMGYPAEMPPKHVEEDRLPVDDLMNFESFTGVSEGRILIP